MAAIGAGEVGTVGGGDTVRLWRLVAVADWRRGSRSTGEASGRRNSKRAPWPAGRSVTYSWPWLVWASRRAMYSPRPSPPAAGPACWAPRADRSKMRSRASAGMPGPWSWTASTTSWHPPVRSWVRWLAGAPGNVLCPPVEVGSMLSSYQAAVGRPCGRRRPGSGPAGRRRFRNGSTVASRRRRQDRPCRSSAPTPVTSTGWSPTSPPPLPGSPTRWWFPPMAAGGGVGPPGPADGRPAGRHRLGGGCPEPGWRRLLRGRAGHPDPWWRCSGACCLSPRSGTARV